MSDQRIGGTISVQKNGQVQKAKGAFTYNIGRPKREAKTGSDGKVHGYTETAQVPFIEGALTDSGDLDLEDLINTVDATITLQLANGKTILLSEAWYANEGTVSTEEGEIPCRFEGMNGEEVPA